MSDTASAPEGERRHGDSEILQLIGEVATQVKGLDTRVKILEEGNLATHDELTRYNGELRANTLLTKQSHEAIFGAGDDPGIKASVDHVQSMLQPAENFFAACGKIGNVALRVSDVIERRPKTLLMLLVSAIAGYSLTSTGKLPEWAGALIKLLS